MVSRKQVLRSSIYLTVREAIGLCAGVVGILALTRLIGPVQYGIYRGALEIVAYFAGVARLGIDAYLIRHEQNPSRQTYHRAFSLLLAGSLLLMGAGFLVTSFLKYWFGDPRYLAPLRLLLTALPLTVLPIPAIAMLERELDYRKVATIETAGKIIYHGSAVILALLGWGFWAPVWGYILWQSWLTVASWVVARFRPHFSWDWRVASRMLSYGISYSLSFWIFGLRQLVNPLVVGRFWGPEYVGYVALVGRFVEVLGFAKPAATRLSLVVLAKVQNDTVRLRRALEEAIGLQSVALGIPLGLFALLVPPFLPRLIGGNWSPAISLYPFVAAGYLASGLFAIHASALFVKKRSLAVIQAYALHTGVFYLASFSLVPGMHLLGYGIAELIAVLAYAMLHISTRAIVPFSYRYAVLWIGTLTPLLASIFLPGAYRFLSLLPSLALSFHPGARQQFRELVLLLRLHRH